VDLFVTEKGEGVVAMHLLSLNSGMVLQSWWLECNWGVMVYWLLVGFPTQLMLLVSKSNIQHIYSSTVMKHMAGKR
jgi:hypothetical protein